MIIKYPKFPENVSRLNNLKNLKYNWDFSYNKLTTINKAFVERFSSIKFSVVVAGSFGRMDASEQSDFDYIILHDNYEDTAELRKNIEEVFIENGIEKPNPDGIFSETLSIEELIQNIGHKNDDLHKLAQRMLLLMESKPLYNERFFESAVEKILEKYLEMVINEPEKEAVFMLNDLIRYFRSIAVNYEYSFWKDNQKWVLRNVKLRHSRVLIYAGLLLLILNSSKERKDKYGYLKEKIFLTPIEKIASVYHDNNDFGVTRLLSAYDMFLGKMNQESVRNSLQAEYKDRFNNSVYSELKVSSDALISELTRFIYKQQGNWSTDVFEYLLF